MAHPLRSRFPISADAASDCCRRRWDSTVSIAKIGDPEVLDISVGGVEIREASELEETLAGDGFTEFDTVAKPYI
jgi:hypothetical protein